MADKKISIIFEAIDKATAEITKIGWSLDSFAKKNKDTFKKMSVAWWIATTAIVWLWNSLVNSAKDMEPVRNSFERLSKDIWQNSNDILSSLKKASKWTINDYDLMLSANKAMSLGVAKNTEEFTTLMDISRVKGQAMGLTMEQAFSDIVTGLGRSSPMILDNLWITIKLWEAQEQYAKILGKSVQEMTDAEKKQALINAVVSQGKEELESAWEVAITSSERFAAMSAEFKNIGYNLWEAFLPVLEEIISAITPIIEKFSNRISENKELAKNLIIAAWIISWLVAFIWALWLALPSVIAWIWALWKAFTIATWPVWLFTGAVAWISWGVYKLFTDFPTYEQQIESLENQMGLLSESYENWLISIEEYDESMKIIWEEMLELEKNSKTLWGSMRNDLASTIDSIKNTPETLWEFFSAVWDSFDFLAENLGETFMNIWDSSDFLAEKLGETFMNIWDSFDFFVEMMMNFLVSLGERLQEWIVKAMEFVQNILQIINEMFWAASWLFNEASALLSEAWESLRVWILDTMGQAYNWIVAKFDALVGAVSSAVSALKRAWTSAKNFLSWWWKDGERALGGTIRAWKSYLVWERWPEIITPTTTSRVHPEIGGNGVSININMGGVVVQNDADENRLVEKISNALKREAQLFSLWIN